MGGSPKGKVTDLNLNPEEKSTIRAEDLWGGGNQGRRLFLVLIPKSGDSQADRKVHKRRRGEKKKGEAGRSFQRLRPTKKGKLSILQVAAKEERW